MIINVAVRGSDIRKFPEKDTKGPVGSLVTSQEEPWPVVENPEG